MNITINKIQDKINNRAEEIKQLMADVRQVTGDNGHVEVEVNGVELRLESEVGKNGFGKATDNVTVRFTKPVIHKYDDGSESYDWGINMIFAPGVGWQWDCLADKAWDHRSTDVGVLEMLKVRFDIEGAEMDNIRKALEAHKAAKKEVYDFFA